MKREKKEEISEDIKKKKSPSPRDKATAEAELCS